MAAAIQSEIAAIENDGHWMFRAGAIMPDHLHLFVRLTGELSLTRCVARLKSKTRTELFAHHLAWQPNFYEHRLRAQDEIEHVVRYIFLNPHRAGIVESGSSYRWFWLGAEEAGWFIPSTQKGLPFPEWLR